MTINEFLHKTYRPAGQQWILQPPRPRLYCSDGWNVSVQAGLYLYCSPPINGDIQYREVELGYPSEPEPELEQWGEGDIYGFVPVDVLQRIVDKHGGIVLDNDPTDEQLRSLWGEEEAAE